MKVRRLKEIKRIKKVIERDLDEIKRNYEDGKIDDKDYREYLNHKIDGKTNEEWVRYCDRFIEKAEKIELGDELEILLRLNEKIKENKKIKRRLERESRKALEDFEKGVISKKDHSMFLNQRIEGKTR